MLLNIDRAEEIEPKRRFRVRDYSILWIGVIVVLSLATRIAAMAYWGIGAIESEGTEYARIAQNLRNGVGYVGLTSPGLELVFPPFYPLLIALTSFLTGNYEWAGRMVSLLFQSLLPLPVFGIASYLYSRRAGLIAALLVTFSPVLVNLSFLVLSEAVYITILLSGVYVALLAFNSSAIRLYLLMGLTFGLAYLTRQEAVAALFLALFFALCFGKGSIATRCKLTGAALVMFALVALPEVIYLYHATGLIRLEMKSSLFSMQQMRTAIAQGNHEAIPEEWAEHSINSKLERTGTNNRPEADVVRETRVHFRQFAHNLKMGVRQNIPVFLEQLDARWLGAPFLPALALLGALRRPWMRHLAASHLFVLMVPLTAVAATFSFTGWVALRYYFVLVPFLLIWAANGLLGIGGWARASTVGLGWDRFGPLMMQWAIPLVVALILATYPIPGVRGLYELQQDSRRTQYVKQMGQWIREHSTQPVTIMDRSTPLAFHADANWIDFPYSDGSLALRFLDAGKVDYVVLRNNEKYTQYYQDWVSHGIPDRRAEPVYQITTPDGDQITLVRWHRESIP